LQVLLNIISNSLKFTEDNGTIQVMLRVIEEQISEEDFTKSKNVA